MCLVHPVLLPGSGRNHAGFPGARASRCQLVADMLCRMDEEIEALRTEVRHLIAMNAASYVAITSLIATHPNPQQFQLHLMLALEGVLGSDRVKGWPDDQREIVRRAVEAFQNIKAAPTIDPLAAGLGERDPRRK